MSNLTGGWEHPYSKLPTLQLENIFNAVGYAALSVEYFEKRKKKDQNLSDPDMQGGNIYNVDDQIPLVRHTSVFFKEIEIIQNIGYTDISFQVSSAESAVCNSSKYKPCWWSPFPTLMKNKSEVFNMFYYKG